MKTLSEWQQQGQFESINGQQIFTRQAGDKNAPVLLLIHGFPSASWDWEGMWDELTQHYYVITLDIATPPTPEVIDALWQLLTHNNGLAVSHKLINYIPQRKQHRERWVGAIINSTVPVKLIAGAKDPISGQHMIDNYRKLIPNANITVMPELGHYPQIEDAIAITAAYLQFRNSIG
ncbi:alpha/beta fold hydrolase [Psychrobacter sp. LV10R520-6]|uniref:alpha/beta fold hydrolase n=1 Tax=Psychrobacter sp. LV10R520-6 TaxID=1415574 RepID=UPI0024CAC287|nr:alpha/beta hydrolase [Psychrobacter sp. LV10R520-6]SNT70475.1 hypothetical protein SAMN04488491_1647 [Psychrobacter sp. LV10R520-6]